MAGKGRFTVPGGLDRVDAAAHATAGVSPFLPMLQVLRMSAFEPTFWYRPIPN